MRIRREFFPADTKYLNMWDNASYLKLVFCKVTHIGRILLMVSVLSLFGTAGQAQHKRYSVRNYSAIDGLPQSQVVSVVEDSNGYLWLGTLGGGLARFDGRDFKVYTTQDGLLSNEIMGLLLDHNQHLWILHSRGITKFNGNSFKTFQNTDSTEKPNWFRRVFEQRDSIFLITGGGSVAKIHNDSVYYWEKRVKPDRAIWKFHPNTNGTNCFWLDDGSFLVRTPNESIYFTPEVKPGKIYYFFDHKGQVYFNSETGMYHLDYAHRRIEKMPWKTEHHVLLYEEKENFFWTSDGNTLFRETFTDPDPKTETVLNDIDVFDVMIDSEGNTWFGSDGRGLFKYFIQDFNRCGPEDLRGVMAILKDREGRSWLGTMSKGLYKIENDKIKTYMEEERSYKNSVRSIKQAPDGTIWIGTGFGLGRYDEREDKFKWFTREDGMAADGTSVIDFDDQNRMWIGTSNGVSQFDGKTFQNYKTPEGLGTNLIWSLHFSKWYKTVFVGNDRGLQSIHDGKVGATQIAGLKNTNIININSYRDSLLSIGTGGAGVVIFNPRAGESRFITTKEGLASDFIYFVVPDKDQTLWVGTEKGINKIRLDNTLEIIENLYYGYDNGLTGVETNSNAYMITPKEKYFGLIDGFYKFNDVSNQPRKTFNLHLTDVKIFYGEYSSREYADSTYGFFNIPSNPQFPPDKNHLTFYFNRVDKRYSSSVRFKYYLENFDKKWSQPSSMNYVTYSNLPPGDYVLRVVSTNKEGSWSDQQIAYPFSIKTPFYQTASFLVGVFVLIAGVVTLILYLRVKQRVNKMIVLERIRVKEQEHLRKEIARDFHDEMGNQLTRIINYVSLLKLNGNGSSNGNGIHDLYSKVEDSAKYLYSGTRDFIWSIDPVNDELSKLFIHIRDFGEKIFEEKAIQFRAYNGIKDMVKLPYGFSREANLIFKEAMTNAFKYSEARNVTLILKRSGEETFEMSIEDDGIGFLTDEISKSNGLQNIRERADKIQAVLRIHSEVRQGTRITLNFTLTKKPKYAITL